MKLIEVKNLRLIRAKFGNIAQQDEGAIAANWDCTKSPKMNQNSLKILDYYLSIKINIQFSWTSFYFLCSPVVMRFLLFFLLLPILLSSQPKDTTKTNFKRHIVKVYPMQFVYFTRLCNSIENVNKIAIPDLTVGYEFKINNRISLDLSLGYSNFDFFMKEDLVYDQTYATLNPYGMLMKIGFKFDFMIKSAKDVKFYIEPLLLGKYVNSKFSAENFKQEWEVSDTSYLIGMYGDYKKKIVGFELLFGVREKACKNIYIEAFTGIGFRVKTNQRKVNSEKHLYEAHDNISGVYIGTFERIDSYNDYYINNTIKYFTFHLGITLGYNF